MVRPKGVAPNPVEDPVGRGSFRLFTRPLKYYKFKKEIIGEEPEKCKPYPNRIVELGMRDSGFTCS